MTSILDIDERLSIEVLNGGLQVRRADGRARYLSAFRLRDACQCVECVHPESGQRLLDPLSIPESIAVLKVHRSHPGVIRIVWNEGHDGHVDSALLRAERVPYRKLEYRSRPVLWDSSLERDLPQAQYGDVTSDPTALRAWLTGADRYGFALLRGCPTTPGTVLAVAELFGYVRETNYGRLFGVRSVVNPSNLAYTGLALGPHTDNPYRDPTPTLQLLHCLSASASGGENTLIDGFRVAEELRSAQPETFDLLCRHPLRYRFRDATTDLSAEFPVISLDPRGAVVAIHFNNRSRTVPDLDDEIDEFYAAYLTFARSLQRPDLEIRVALAPGDLLLMDNLRVLHGRTGFSAAGERHLQGCYADRDGLRSRLAVLQRGSKAEDG